MSRKIKIIFTLSILLNVVFIGFVAGGGFRIYKHFGGDFKRELSSLPSDVRQNIDKAYQQSRLEMRSLFQAAKHAKKDVRDVLNQDVFDPQKYDLTMGRLNQVRYNMMQVQARKTGKIASQLSVDDRRKFAGYLLRGGIRGGGKIRDMINERQQNAQVGGNNSVGKAVDNAGIPKVIPVQEEPFDPVMLPMPNFE